MVQDKDLISIQEARTLAKNSTVAFEELKKMSMEQIDKIVKSMVDEVKVHSEELARMAVEETGFGNVHDKMVKNDVASSALYETIKDMKTVGVLKEDTTKKITEIAVPVGTVAGLIPSTNPTSTTIYKSIIALKAGNPIVFSPHPAAVNCIKRTVDILQNAAEKAGAPANCVQTMSTPAIAGTDELMKNEHIKMILATGGSAMVKAAYSSGTPALGVGPGNVPAYIEKTADIKEAVRKVFSSKTFDNGVICASEQEIVAETCIKEQVLKEIKAQGGYILNPQEMEAVGKAITKPNGALNPKVVGKTAVKIAEMANITVPAGTRVLCGEERNVGHKHPFSIEKLSPTLGLYFEENNEACFARCEEILRFSGIGHSASIHSNNNEIIREFGIRQPASRILVNTPSTQGAVGATTCLAPALTLGCGSIGGSATGDNITPLHLINIKRIASEVRPYNDDSVKTNTSNCNAIDIDKITKMVIDTLKTL